MQSVEIYMRIYLDIDENQIIKDCKFAKNLWLWRNSGNQQYGTELVKGKPFREAL